MVLKIILLLLIGTCSQYAQCMQSEPFVVSELKQFITPPKNQSYEEWLRQPLAKKFINSSVWSQSIVHDLSLKNDDKNIDALLACQLLLNEIEENNQKIAKKHKRTQYFRLCNIIVPIITFVGQTYFHLHGPLETLFTSYLASKCTSNIIKFNNDSKNYLYHSKALLKIKNEISKKINAYEEKMKEKNNDY